MSRSLKPAAMQCSRRQPRSPPRPALPATRAARPRRRCSPPWLGCRDRARSRAAVARQIHHPWAHPEGGASARARLALGARLEVSGACVRDARRSESLAHPLLAPGSLGHRHESRFGEQRLGAGPREGRGHAGALFGAADRVSFDVFVPRRLISRMAAASNAVATPRPR